MSNIVTVDDGNFAEVVLNAKQPILVDFWAEWCGPCKAIAPILTELAEDFAGKVTIAKMDVDTNKEIPVEYAIRSIPTLILFKDGQALEPLIGMLSKAQLADYLNQQL